MLQKVNILCPLTIRDFQCVTLDDNPHLYDGFQHIKFILTQIFEECTPDIFHTSTAGMGQRGYGTLTPHQILTRLMALYCKPSLTEHDHAITKPHDPMDFRVLIKVMLREDEEIHMFLLANPDNTSRGKPISSRTPPLR